MAFDATTKKPKPQAQPGENPYASLTGSPDLTDASSAPLGDGGGATPTGFVNFDGYFNANADAAAKGATGLQTSAAQKGQGALGEIGKAQSAFTGAVNAGTAQGPSTADFWTASGYGPRQPGQSDMGHGGQPTGPGSGYAGGKTPTPPPQGAQPPQGWQPGQGGGSDADNQRWAAGANRAEQGYTGPDGLSAMDGYGKLATDVAGAADEANALASGNAGIAGALKGSANAGADAALLGAAGRQGFANVGKQYGGLKSSLDAANARSVQQADAGKQNSDNALKQYGLLAQQEDATNAKMKAATPDDSTPDPLDQWGGFDPATQKYGQTQADTNQGDQVRWDMGNSDQGLGMGPVGDSNPWINSSGNWEQWFGGSDSAGTSPQELGLTESQIYSLSLMTPGQRGAWLDNYYSKHKNKDGG